MEHGSTGTRNASRSGEGAEETSADHRTASDDTVKPSDADLRVRVGSFTDGDLTGIFVADDGTGIPTDDHERVLEDGFSTSEHGTGLGLSIVSDIAAGHGWDVRVADSESGGTRIELVTGARPTEAVRPATRE
ncbi:Histidine kinase-, DNA gyrase B-, and HSP90-like ATPase [Halorientalis persicus]|uniref:histidine kinase n=1 Tax=Halorientalis persicus TaxID=1367881 RepID=A0A1H8T4P2_9EURY|nr:Histidine kinase-, DNA gyrase B-, and HSP90-like ATPase [Halorientalis persicus]